ASAQHPRLLPEVDLRMLGVREGDEPGVRMEEGRGPFPDVARHLQGAARARAARIRAGGSGGEATEAEVRFVAHPLGPPGVAALSMALVPACGSLPFGLGRKPPAHPPRVRVGLVPRDVLNGLVAREGLAVSEARSLPAAVR